MNFPDGETLLSQPIEITDGQVVEGEGIGNTVIVVEHQDSYAFIVNLGNRPRTRPVEFRNLTITSPSPRTGGAGILFQGSPSGVRHKIESMHIKNQHTGIHFADAVAFTVKDSLITHTSMGGRGIVIQNRPQADAGDSVIDNVLFNDNHKTAQAAIYQQDSGGLNAVNCKMLYFDYGYLMMTVQGGATSQLTVLGNSMEHQRQAGVKIAGEGDFSLFDISHNEITFPKIGILIESHQIGRIESNVMIGQGTGVLVTGGEEWMIANNSIYGAATGIQLGANTNKNRIAQNRLDCVTPVINDSATSTWDGVK